jgi:predicted TIM-barrel fold metal-dependent hydrolase
MQVDTHTHVVADDAARYPLDPRPGAGSWFREAPYTVEALLGQMDAARVDRAVLVQAVSAYQHDNRYVVDSARAHPGRCASVACLDLALPDAAEQLRRLALEHGVRGLRWWALDGQPLGEPRAVWDELARLGLPVVVTLFDDRLEELLALVPSLPPVPIAIDHCAFADLSAGVPDVLAALAAQPTVHWKVSTIVLDGLIEHGDVRDGVAELSRRLGADRLLWGSDFSQTLDRPYADLAELARHAAEKLDADARAGFLGANALRLWPELAP